MTRQCCGLSARNRRFWGHESKLSRCNSRLDAVTGLDGHLKSDMPAKRSQEQASWEARSWSCFRPFSTMHARQLWQLSRIVRSASLATPRVQVRQDHSDMPSCEVLYCQRVAYITC